MRRELDEFGDRDLALVYLARKLKEALRIEELFTSAQLDYVVEPDTYQAGLLFPRTRVGAFFYVVTEDVPAAREVLERSGLRLFAGE